MHRRLFIVSYLALCMDAAYADFATWDCGQSKNGKQWGCVRKSIPEDPTIEEPVAEPTPAPVTPKYAPETKVQTVPFTETVEPPQPSSESAPKVSLPSPTKLAPAVTIAPNDAVKTATQSSEPLATTPAPTEDLGFRLLEPAFSHRQEQIFSRLQARLKIDPWGNCEVSPQAKNPYENLPRGKDLRENAPINIESNYSETFDKEVSTFSGNVNINRADQNVLADKVNYNSVSDSIDAQGNVYYSEDELSMFSDSALLKLNTDEARLRGSLFISPRAPIRGRAGTVYRETKEFSHFKDVAYTSCKPGNQDWAIHADRLKMNKLTGKAAAKNAWLEFKGVPVLYTPYISFPMDNRRMTGLLNPYWSHNGQNGVDITMPFYWNIAPNYDATFRPRYMVNRGFMIGSDLRYMNKWSNNHLSFDILFNDDKSTSIDNTTPNPNHNTERYRASFKNQSILTPHMNANIDLNYVSDNQYISELGHALSFTNFSHIQSIADLNYARKDVVFLTRVESYQTINPAIQNSLRPYRKIPQVMLNLNHDFENMPLPVNVGMENEFVYFQHNHNVYGQRFNIKPYVSLPYKSASGFAIPKASFLHTSYFLNDGNVTNVNGFASRDSNYNRELPIFSLDTGLFAESNFRISSTNYTHTLEPRLFYLYIPRTNQDELPIFDTAIYYTDFDSLFRENRFTGVDRFQNANQLTFALTSRLLDNNDGSERLKASIGEVVYFQDRDAQRVFAPDLNTLDTQGRPDPNYHFPYYDFLGKETDQFSDIFGQLNGKITDTLSFTSGLQYNPHNGNKPVLPRKQIDLHYRNRSGFLFNIGFHDISNRNLSIYTASSNINTTIRQSDISGRIPLYDNWFMVGRWQYSFFYDKTAESFLGLEKENCCWRFRIIGRRYINGLTTISNPANFSTLPTVLGESQTTVMFQIELKSLSAFGDNVDTFLKRNIYGYSDL